MDNVLVDFPSAIPLIPKETLEKYGNHADLVPGIFSMMKPVKGAIEDYHYLAKYFDVYILSTAPWDNPSSWTDKLLWVKQYLPDVAYKRLILTHHKDLNRGDFLIDDREKNGASEFQGKLIRFGSEEFPDWKAVLKYFEEYRTSYHFEEERWLMCDQQKNLLEKMMKGRLSFNEGYLYKYDKRFKQIADDEAARLKLRKKA